MKKIIALFSCIFCLMSFAAFAAPQEPELPDTEEVFDSETEEEIDQVVGLPAAEVIGRLSDIKFIGNEKALNKAVFKSFNHRKQDGLNAAIEKIRMPLVEKKDGKIVNRTADFNVAKRIVEVFPADSSDSLVRMYQSGSEFEKVNVIRASGLVSNQKIKKFLLSALEDKTVVDERFPNADMIGQPMRICDHAYNQLVLRYSVQNVLRTLSTIHAPADRDYHIGTLKAAALN